MTSQWTTSLSPAMLAAMALLLGATVGLCVMNWWRRRTRAAALMETLRLVVVVLIMVTLAQPERVDREPVTEEPEIVVLHDASDSMSTRDLVMAGSNVISRGQWLDEALGTNFWEPLEQQARVSVEAFARPGEGTNAASLAGTDLNQTLDSVLERPNPPKAVLLLTDGDWNTGASPLEAAGRLRARQVPVFGVMVGRESPLPDLVLEPVTAPSYGLLGEQIALPFRVRSFLPREVRTTVALGGAGVATVRKEIVLPPYGQVQDSVLWMPKAVGEYLFQLSLPVQPDEYLDNNNERSFRIAIRTEKLRVLVIDSFPRWEYRYLRNALERDPGVEVNCLLFHPGMGPGQGRSYIDAFPASREGLAQYDVVFLGDVGIGDGELTEEQFTLLRGLVEQQGSGLVFLPGRRGRLASVLNSPLAELLPVHLDASNFGGMTSPLENPVLLTLPGRAHFLTRLSGSEARNASIWKGLPGFYWCAAVERAKPGAEVLAVHPSIRNAYGRMPLLAIRPFGQGEVLFLGIDAAWRWRRGVEDKYHYRFWGQVVRWMAHKRHMAEGEGLRLTFSPEQPKAGDQIFFQATVLDLLDWKESETLSAQIDSPSGQTERLELNPVQGGWGVYQGGFQASEGGAYRLALDGSRPGRRLETTLVVDAPIVEKLGQPANGGILREMAELTRGRNGAIEDLDQIVRQIALLPEATPAERRFRLWSNPWWGGAILGLLAIYWTARKAAGMI